VNAIAIDRYLVNSCRVKTKSMMPYSVRDPLSESIAPSGTAWGAEGLRGNEANENNFMVLALAPARKRQSIKVLHKGT